MKYYRKKKVYHKSKVLKLLISEEFLIKGCWRFEKGYQKLDGLYLHQQWASSEGEIVRHLCGDNRCVNPLHLVKGNDIDNAKDELDVRNFSVGVLQKLIGEKYDDKYSKELSILILIPRIRRIYSSEFKSMSEIALYAREEYRKWFERKFANSYNEEDDKLRFNNIRQKFISLASRNDIDIRRIGG